MSTIIPHILTKIIFRKTKSNCVLVYFSQKDTRHFPVMLQVELICCEYSCSLEKYIFRTLSNIYNGTLCKTVDDFFALSILIHQRFIKDIWQGRKHTPQKWRKKIMLPFHLKYFVCKVHIQAIPSIFKWLISGTNKKTI